VHRVVREKITTASGKPDPQTTVREKEDPAFGAGSEGSTRLFVVVTVVALLEMARQGEIRVEQNENFSEIWIARSRRREKARTMAHPRERLPERIKKPRITHPRNEPRLNR